MRDQKPGFDNSAYPVEFLNSGNDPIGASEGFTWSKLQLLQTGRASLNLSGAHLSQLLSNRFKENIGS